MFKYLASAAALALTAGAISAQESKTDKPETFGATVKTKAEAQRSAETKGIGADVSAAARERNALRQPTRDGNDDEDDADDVDDDTDADADVAVTGRANANVKSAAVQAELVAAARGDNSAVKANTGAVADLRSARSGREFGAEARAAASDARSAAADGRQITADARATAQQAREQAQTIRDTVRNARRGRGG